MNSLGIFAWLGPAASSGCFGAAWAGGVWVQECVQQEWFVEQAALAVAFWLGSHGWPFATQGSSAYRL